MDDQRHSLALALARADLTYVHGAIMRADDPTGHWPFLQYAAMTSFETRRFLGSELGYPMPDALWSDVMAAAARNAGKYFDDNRRHLGGVVDYFAQLIAANTDFFRPPERSFRKLDVFRRDIAILLFDDVPVMTNIGGFFGAGMSPSDLKQQDQLGFRVRDLAAGIGQMVGWLGAPLDHQGPLAWTPDRFVWRDAHAGEVLGEVFGGDFEPHLAAAMLTIQNATSVASRLSRTDCCPSCKTAALKHRLVVAYQAVSSVSRLSESAFSPSGVGAEHVRRVLDHQDCVALGGAGYRKLRNGLLHLGLTDIPVRGDSALTMSAVIRHYTGEESPEDAVGVVERALTVVAESLESWCLTPRDSGGGLHGLLHRPIR